MEYIQDTDGAWLEPHRDIPEKLFSLVVYLFTGPDAKEWGTDIYDAERRWLGRSSYRACSAAIGPSGPRSSSTLVDESAARFDFDGTSTTT